MNTLIFLLLLPLVSFCEDKLGFVFEMVRHGARAPLKTPDPFKFKVNKGDLTASGMR
jgi:hypothetical protein